MTLASRATTREPTGVRVPKLSWRRITHCRRARSGGVVGQRQLGIAQDLEDGLPVVEQLTARAWVF